MASVLGEIDFYRVILFSVSLAPLVTDLASLGFDSIFGFSTGVLATSFGLEVFSGLAVCFLDLPCLSSASKDFISG